MNKLWKIGKDFGILTLGTVVAACGVFFFLVPSRVTVGSVSGLSVVLAQFLPLPVSALTMVMNLYSSPQATEITVYGKNGEMLRTENLHLNAMEVRVLE